MRSARSSGSVAASSRPSAMSGTNVSVSNTESTPCWMTAIRSRPRPVSMLLAGSGASVGRPSASWPSSYCVKTRFQYSRKRSFSPPGRSSSVPQSRPRSMYSSLHGPHGPVSPACQKFSERGQQDDALARHADRQPGLDRLLVGAEAELLVALEDRDPDVVGVEAEARLRQLPRHLDGGLLEVVADREVAEHLEERQVAGRCCRRSRCRSCESTSAPSSGAGAAASPRRGSTARAGACPPSSAGPRRPRPPARATPTAATGGRAPRSTRGTSCGSRRSSCPWCQAIVAHPTMASPRRKTAVCPGAAPSNGSSRWI